MLIDKAEVRTLIPHAGAMCLLDAVLAWDAERIVCITTTAHDPSHPLRCRESLSSVHAIEYGGQAAALHGALCARRDGQTAPPGYLAAVRDAYWGVTTLDRVSAPLEVAAQRLLGDAARCIYAIQLRAAEQLLAEARITIMPQPGAGGSM
jgi:predicted hotdog family 3-hydroxylacyl-ACP dehydratase